ncbi:Translation initiation factor 3 subunit J component [Vermiconidia calcicola]|uniref:Translation initiation factor 3 subunit J component n=1 Tax=Vermiconidia calcicola TaxID=1690605 RepID=A0ACC3NK84_9PEZI|nr:Translation initiation factor 3 subunit J component [Vermiconidia calcicola]
MAPSKAPTSWDDEESESTPPSSPPVLAPRRNKFEDEEDSDVVESWDAEPDSEEEREKEKKAAEAKAKADAAAKAAHKSKTQRIEEKKLENQRRREAEGEDSSDEDEDEAARRARMRASEQESDLRNAEDLFGGVGGVPEKRAAAVKPVTIQDGDDPANTVDLSSLKIFNPNTAPQFAKLRETLVPLLNGNSKKAAYPPFLQEFAKQLVKDLNSDQVKKISSALTTISNEKMREEKAADKGGKKSKAAKNKISLGASRDVAHKADVTNYADDGLDDDDFM